MIFCSLGIDNEKRVLKTHGTHFSAFFFFLFQFPFFPFIIFSSASSQEPTAAHNPQQRRSPAHACWPPAVLAWRSRVPLYRSARPGQPPPPTCPTPFHPPLPTRPAASKASASKSADDGQALPCMSHIRVGSSSAPPAPPSRQRARLGVPPWESTDLCSKPPPRCAILKFPADALYVQGAIRRWLG